MNWHDVWGDTNTNFVLLLLYLLPAAQWLTGVLRAFSNKSLDLEYLDVFIRSDVAGRILPITILLVLGRVITVAAPGDFQVPGLDLSMLTGAGVVAAAVYLTVVAKRLLDNVNPSAPDQLPARE